MRTFTAICVVSAIVHIVLLFAVATPYQRQTAHGETMSVELVSSDDAPPGNEGDGNDPASAPSQQQQKPQAEETIPDFSKLRLSDTPSMPQDEQQKQAAAPPEKKPQAQQQQAQEQGSQGQQSAGQQTSPQQERQAQKSRGQTDSQQQQPQQAQNAQQQPAPQAQKSSMLQQMMSLTPNTQPLDQAATDELPTDPYERLAMLTSIPSVLKDGSPEGEKSDAKAQLAPADIATFKAHLKTCWKLPEGLSENDKVKVIIRIVLLPNGALAKEPELIEAPPGPMVEFALPISKSARVALRQCAPYKMLPAEKYNEWRVLDINFSPDEMARG